MNGGALSISGKRVNPECAVNGLYGHAQLTKAESKAFYSPSNARLFQARGKIMIKTYSIFYVPNIFSIRERMKIY